MVAAFIGLKSQAGPPPRKYFEIRSSVCNTLV